MDDLSDESDVNPSEMARMVEDLDDLDNTLLGGSLRKQDPYSTAKRDTEITEAKKKVAFKDFDTDDPLTDLLSDDDTSYNVKKPIVSKAKSNLVADLFGIKNSKSEDKLITEATKSKILPEVQKFDDNKQRIDTEGNLIFPINKKSSSTISSEGFSISQNIREKSRSNEVITSKTENPQKLPNVNARKSLLMKDSFDTKTRTYPTKEIDASPSLSKSNVQNLPRPVSVSEPSKPEQSAKISSDYIMDPGIFREPRRGRNNSSVISDPLGLFSAPKQSEPVVQTTADLEKKTDLQSEKKLGQDDLPEWLGGSAKTKETTMEKEKQEMNREKMSAEAAAKSPLTSLVNTGESRTNETTTDLPCQKNHDTNIFYPDVSGMMSTQFDQQAALITMQQQEYELRTAATLSHQNEQVEKIVENQKAKLNEQAKMFNVLMKHQLDRQSMLETQMKIQQARIDHYIQTLMSQPTAMPKEIILEEKNPNNIDNEEDKSSSPETLIKKLELEKVHLEKTIEALMENHDKEISILQESYEKQMLFLRQGIEKLEKSMYENCASLENEHAKKMDKLKNEKEEIEQSYTEEIKRLRKREKIFIEEIYDRHSHDVELLQKEHAETINEISRAKEIERNAVETINNHKTDLDDLLQRSQLVVDNFQNYQKKLEERNADFDETRGTYLRKQEENLQLLRDQLNLQQESLVEERKRLLDISQRLDVGTIQLTTEFKKNRSLINETEERLATREHTLAREKQLFNEQMKWEREHLRVIKEAWTKEQERQMELIFKEREAVANERAKLDVFDRLKKGSEDPAKAELDVALRTAQEAANEANQEKQRWQEKCRALEAAKRSLREKEKHLIHRAKELESLTQSALLKRDEGLRALKEAKYIEERHKEHLAGLQNQLRSLAHRENKKANEKLARERIAAKIYPIEKPEKDTTVDRASPVHYVTERSLISNSQISTHFKDVVDPHLLLLKLNLDNKLDTSDDLLAAMQVISQ